MTRNITDLKFRKMSALLIFACKKTHTTLGQVAQLIEASYCTKTKTKKHQKPRIKHTHTHIHTSVR